MKAVIRSVVCLVCGFIAAYLNGIYKYDSFSYLEFLTPKQVAINTCENVAIVAFTFVVIELLISTYKSYKE